MNSCVERFRAKEAKRFKVKVGVFAIIRDVESRVLLLRRFQTGTQDGSYVLPMGSHDGAEPLVDSVIREVQEETNLVADKSGVVFRHLMHRMHQESEEISFEQMDVIFEITRYSGELHNNEPQKCDDLAFFAIDALPTSTALFARRMIEACAKGEAYTEFGWPKN